MVQLVRHPQTKERDTDRLHLNHRATSRLYCVNETFRKSTRVRLPSDGRWPTGQEHSGSRWHCMLNFGGSRRPCVLGHTLFHGGELSFVP